MKGPKTSHYRILSFTFFNRLTCKVCEKAKRSLFQPNKVYTVTPSLALHSLIYETLSTRATGGVSYEGVAISYKTERFKQKDNSLSPHQLGREQLVTVVRSLESGAMAVVHQGETDRVVPG